MKHRIFLVPLLVALSAGIVAGCASAPSTGPIPSAVSDGASKPEDAVTRVAVHGDRGLASRLPEGKVAITVESPVAFVVGAPEAKGTAAKVFAREFSEGGGEFAAVGAALGLAVGGLLGTSQHEIDAGSQAIESATKSDRWDHRVAMAIFAHLAKSRPEQVQRVADGMPARRDVRPRVRLDPSTLSHVWETNDVHPLAGSGVDVLVAIRTTYRGLDNVPVKSAEAFGTLKAMFSPFEVLVTLQVTAVRVADWSKLGSITVVRRSAPRSFGAWTVDSAQAVEGELNTAYDEIAEQILSAL